MTARVVGASCKVLVVGGLASCASDSAAPGSAEPPSTSETSSPTSERAAEPDGFPTTRFAGLGDEPVSDELAAELQQVLETSGTGHGVTAALFTPEGTWSGATGIAAGDRAMVPEDQMSIADRLPPDLDFDTNGATIEQLLSMRSGVFDFATDDSIRVRLRRDPKHVWTLEERLATA